MTLQKCLLGAALTLVMAACAAPPNNGADVQRTLVRRGDVQIETLSQGRGPTVVILPSLGRGAEDYDEVARLLAADGLRPTPGQ